MRLLLFQFKDGSRAHLFTEQPLDYRQLVAKYPEIKGCMYANEYYVDCGTHEVTTDHLFLVRSGDKLREIASGTDRKNKTVARKV